jgi:hypothetical protein
MTLLLMEDDGLNADTAAAAATIRSGRNNMIARKQLFLPFLPMDSGNLSMARRKLLMYCVMDDGWKEARTLVSKFSDFSLSFFFF